MFLIIGSSHDDVLFYETSLKNAKEVTLTSKHKALVGQIINQDVMVLSNVYTSYITAALLANIIDTYKIVLVICVGRCQTFTDNLNIGQVVVSKNTIFGDVNQVAAVKGNYLGQVPGFNRFLETNSTILKTVHTVFERVGLDTVKEATVVSGSMLRNSEQFVLNIKNEKATTKRTTGSEVEKQEITHLSEYIVSDSESGGIALSSELFGISYITVKVVEGRAGNDVPLDTYLKVLKQYSYVGKAILSFIGELSRNDIERMEDLK